MAEKGVDLIDLAVRLRVDAVVHHMHALRIDERVAVEHVVTHARTDGDDGIGVVIRGVLHP